KIFSNFNRKEVLKMIGECKFFVDEREDLFPKLKEVEDGE
ncbi:hypothetical protein LCGC14_1661260, partial [marine sediment metagenome]